MAERLPDVLRLAAQALKLLLAAGSDLLELRPAFEAAPGPMFMLAEAIGEQVRLSELFRRRSFMEAEARGLETPLFFNIHPEECRDPERLLGELRTVLGGVCGTDLALVGLRSHPASVLASFSSFPAVLGHENVAARFGYRTRFLPVGAELADVGSPTQMAVFER